MKPTQGTVLTPHTRWRTVAIALALTLAGSRAAEAQPRPAPACIENGKALEASANAALLAFRDALGKDLNSGDGRFASGVRAAAGGGLAIAQVAACYAGAFVMTGQAIDVMLHCDGGGGEVPHSSGGPAAEAACQESVRNMNKTTRDLLILADDSDRSRRTANDELNVFLSTNPPEPLRTKAREFRDRLAAYGAASDACLKEAKNWRPPQASLPAPKKFVPPPPPPTPPALTTFDGWVGSHLAVHLDSGKATVGSAEATLDGGVTISLKSDPLTKVSVNGRVVLKTAVAVSAAPAGNMQAAGGISAAGIGANLAQTGGPSLRTWNSLEGQGSVSVSLWGFNASLGGGDGLRAGSDGVVFFGNRSFNFLGCRYDTDDASRVEAASVTMHGRLACGSFLLTESTTRSAPSGRSGNGKLSFFGHTYDMTFDLGTSRLKAHGRYQAPSTGWTRLPGLDAEYRVSRPTVDVSLDGPSVSATFDTDKVEVETVSKNKSGQPWAQASIDPDPVTVAADGSLLLRLAQLPSVQDSERAARNVCLAAANNIPPGNAHDAAVGACNSNHPAPPSIPNVPTSMTVSVGVVVK